MPKPVIGDYEGAAEILQRFIDESQAANQLPLLTPDGEFTGEFYDKRRGVPDLQPDPSRLTAHLEFMKRRNPGRKLLIPGQRIPDFQHVDPFESETVGDYITNTLASAYMQSLTGDIEKLLPFADDKADLFGLIDARKMQGYQPSTGEQIASGVLSFFMPADLATLSLGGAGVAAKGLKFGSLLGKAVNIERVGGLGYRLAPSVVKAAEALKIGARGQKALEAATVMGSALGTYEGTRALAQGRYTDIPKEIGKGAVFGASMAMAGGLLPSVILEAVPGSAGARLAESAIAKGVTKGGVEIATFGTMSGLLEGRSPTRDDYVHAAGFLLGMKALALPGELKQRAARLRLQEEMNRLIESEKNFENATVSEVDNIARSSGFNYTGTIQAFREGTKDSFRLGDFFRNKRSRKAFKKVLDVEVRRATDADVPTGEEGKTGWTWSEKGENGDIKLFLNTDHPESLAITLFHEALHANQIRNGGALREWRSAERKQTPEGTEPGRPGAFERQVARLVSSGGGLEAPARAKAIRSGLAHAKYKQETAAKAERSAAKVISERPTTVGARQKAIRSGLAHAKYKQEARERAEKSAAKVEAQRPNLTGAQQRKWVKQTSAPEGVTVKADKIEGIGGHAQTEIRGLVAQRGGSAKISSITVKSEKTPRSSNPRLYGMGRSGFVVGEQTTKANGGTSMVLLDVPTNNHSLGRTMVTKALSYADSKGKKLYVSPKLGKTSLFQKLVEEGKVKKVGKLLQVQGGEVAFRTSIEAQARAEAKKYGVEFRGVLEFPSGRKSFNWHDPKHKGDIYTDSIEELAAHVKKKRADFKDGDTAYRTAVKAAEEIHPTVAKMLRYWDKATYWVKPLKQARNTFKHTTSQEFVKNGGEVDQVIDRSSILRGPWIEEFNTLVHEYARRNGLKDLKPGAWDSGPLRKKKLAVAQKLYDDIAATDAKGNGPAPEFRRLLNRVGDEIQRVNPDFRKWLGNAGGDKGYITRIIKKDVANKLREDLGSLVEQIRALPKGTSDKAVLEAIARSSGLVKEGVDYILKNNRGDVKTAKQAFEALVGKVVREDWSMPYFMKDRKLPLPSQWIERDARLVMAEYLNDAANYVAQAEKWGPDYKGLTDKLRKIRMASRSEADRLSLLLKRWMGVHIPGDQLSSKAQNILGAYASAQVLFKIGLGGATILNVAQPLISIIPEVGLWNTLQGGLRLFDPKWRGELRKSGIIDAMDLQAIEAVVGSRPGGLMGEFADRVTRVSGFQGINRGLLYLAASSMERAIPKWAERAKSDTLVGRHARKRLSDVGINWREPITNEQKLKAMVKFARTSQLMKDYLRDPFIANDPHFRTLFLFKRFGLRQASYMGDMMRREVIERGNPMPLIRLAAGGYLGGTGIVWALNTIKSWGSGEPVLRDDDGLLEHFITDITTIGAFGMMGDIAIINKISDIPSALKFAFTPVVVSDAEKIFENFQLFTDDWERYGDAWLATKRNTYRMFDILGTWPRAGAKVLLTPGQKDRRLIHKKGQQRTEIFKLISAGESKLAGDRLIRWNETAPDEYRLTAADFTYKELRSWMERKAKAFAESEAKKDTPEFRKVERAKIRELIAEMRKRNPDLGVVRQAARR